MSESDKKQRRRLAVEKLAKIFGKDPLEIGDLSSSESESDDGSEDKFRRELFAIVKDPRLVDTLTGNGAMLDPNYWQSVTRHDTAAVCAAAPSHKSSHQRVFFEEGCSTKEEMIAELAFEGFAAVNKNSPDIFAADGASPMVEDSLLSSANLEASLAEKVKALVEAGWPAVFVFMLPEAWAFLEERVWPCAALVLGSDCVLEPTVYAWRAGDVVGGGGGCGGTRASTTAHANFSLPHRDYSFSESHFSTPGEEAYDSLVVSSSKSHSAPISPHVGGAGAAADGDDGNDVGLGEGACHELPSLLCAWVPLTDASTHSGCLHFLPREFDARFFGRDDDHLRAATRQKPTTTTTKDVSTTEGDSREVTRAGEGGGGGGGDAAAATVEVRFDLGSIRAVPVRAGCPLLWRGNVVHWGGRCGSRQQEGGGGPRISLGCTFRAKNAQEVGANSHEECVVFSE